MKKIELRRSDMKVYDFPLSALVDNKSNPRDSSPVLLGMGYGIFKRLDDSTKPALMEMALSDNPSDQAAFVDLIERFEPDLAAMGADFLDKGMLQPIGVCQSDRGNTYEVVYGCRRVLAAAYNYCKTHATNNPTISGTLREYNEHDRAFIAFSENHHRLGQTAIDEAKHFLRMHNLGIQDDEIASRCGVNKQFVRNRLKLNELPQPIQEQIASGQVAVSKAIRMASEELSEEEIKKKKTRHRVPTLREWKDIYENDGTISEEIRQFIAKRVLQVRHSKR